MSSEFRNDCRGVSEAISYIFVLGITIVFVIGGFVAFSLVGDAGDYHKENQIKAEGHQLKGAIEKVDRRVRVSDSTGPIGIHITLSTHIGNSKYEIRTVQYPAGGSYIILQTKTGDLKKRIEIVTQTQLKNSTVPGGKIYIVRKDGDSTISVVSEE